MHSSSHRTIMPAIAAAAAVACCALTSAQSVPFTAITGEIGPGAEYEIDMPTASWNQDLVVFVQGIGDPSMPVDLPEPGLLRNTLTSQGFALIFTSRTINGYGAVKDGIIRTHQLRDVFAANVGIPARTYLIGRSLGALVSVALVERFPDQYDGAVLGSGLLGGGPAEVKYLADTWVLFDYFFPGVLPSDPFAAPPAGGFVPGNPIYDGALAALQQGLQLPGQPTLQFACAAHLQTANVQEIITTAMTVIGFMLTQDHALLELTNGHMFYDNTATEYSGCGDNAALNDGVQRYVGDPSALEYVQHYYTPSGELHVPIITLHKTRDPIAPIGHEQLYLDRVNEAGAGQFLLQRTIVGFGHGSFAPGVETSAFADLVQWVRTGVKPQS